MSPPKQARKAVKKHTSQFHTAAHAAGLSPQPGKTAVKAEYRSGISTVSGASFSHSVDMDGDFTTSEPHAARWDYGLGILKSHEMAFWVEAHPASSTGEVSRMLAKLNWLKQKLEESKFKNLGEMTNRARSNAIAFRWLAQTGAIRIRPGSREAALLAQAGLAFPARHVRLP